MTLPFGPTTWFKRSDIPARTISGAISGPVTGTFSPSFHPKSKFLAVQGATAHSFTTFYNTFLISLDEGATWSEVYAGDAETEDNTEVVFKNFSLDFTDAFDIEHVYHYQLRYHFTHSFFLADGSLKPGWIDMYMGEEVEGVFLGYNKIQRLYSWSAIVADPANTGGQAAFNTGISAGRPTFIPGSGPLGEDAYWMCLGFSYHAGGTNNAVTTSVSDLWRSFDGVVWENVRDMVPIFGSGGGQLTLTPNGVRTIFQVGALLKYTDEPNLVTATWLTGSPPLNAQSIIAMYGGTLVTWVNGSLIGGGIVYVSCDNGASFTAAGVTGYNIPVNRGALIAKIGSTEALLITADFGTNLRAYYTTNGGETWVDQGIWNTSSTGGVAEGIFLTKDGAPLCVTRDQHVFLSSGRALGTFSARTVCPLANSGLAKAEFLNCGHPIHVESCP